MSILVNVKTCFDIFSTEYIVSNVISYKRKYKLKKVIFELFFLELVKLGWAHKKLKDL